MKMLLEVDDLWDRDQIQAQLVPLKERNKAVVVNAFCVPNKLGEVHMLREIYPWIQFYIHGFEHTHFECLEWTAEKAFALLSKAREMGYQPVFKAPNYSMDDETGHACSVLNIYLVHNPTYIPDVLGLKAYPAGKNWPKHTRVSAHLVDYPGCGDYINIHPGLSPDSLKEVTEFLNYEAFIEQGPMCE